jgi:DNA-binding transcriptional MerR regulator
MPDTAVGIGQMVQDLRSEFPGLTISKIRFLEKQGLIDPPRTASGYRKFPSEVISRIREILRLQRDEYLPLEVIQDRLGDWIPNNEKKTPKRTGPFTTAELAREADAPLALIAELTRHGVLREGPEGFTNLSVDIAVAAQLVLSFGLEPRHLRTVRSGAESMAASVRGRSEALMRSRKPSSDGQLAELLQSAADSLSDLGTAVAADELAKLSQP